MSGSSGNNGGLNNSQDPPQLQRTGTLSPIGISRTCLNERPPASVVTISFDQEGHTRIRTSGMSNKGAIDLSIELLELLLQVLRKYAKISKRSIAEALDRVRTTHTHTHSLTHSLTGRLPSLSPTCSLIVSTNRQAKIHYLQPFRVESESCTICATCTS